MIKGVSRLHMYKGGMTLLTGVLNRMPGKASLYFSALAVSLFSVFCWLIDYESFPFGCIGVILSRLWWGVIARLWWISCRQKSRNVWKWVCALISESNISSRAYSAPSLYVVSSTYWTNKERLIYFQVIKSAFFNKWKGGLLGLCLHGLRRRRANN